MNRSKKLYFFSGLVIAVAIIFMICHDLPPNTSLVSIKPSGWGGSPVEQKLLSHTGITRL